MNFSLVFIFGKMFSPICQMGLDRAVKQPLSRDPDPISFHVEEPSEQCGALV